MRLGNISIIGTNGYFKTVFKDTVLEGVKPSVKKPGIIDNLESIARVASNTLIEIHHDLGMDRVKRVVKFLDKDNIDSAKKLISGLESVVKANHVSCSVSASQLHGMIDKMRLRSGITMSQVKSKHAEWSKAGKSKSYEATSSRDGGVFVAVKDYDFYLTNKSTAGMGQCGKVLGSSAYVDKFTGKVFGGIKMTSSSQTDTYQAIISKQINAIVNTIRSDISADISQHKYMKYDERELIKAVVRELYSRTPVSYPIVTLEQSLLKMRRLEDYDNKVIEIMRKGPFEPVDAELLWENGKNILNITASVWFPMFDASNPDHVDRKAEAIREFLEWGGGVERTVFGGQKMTVNVDVVENNASFSIIILFWSPTDTSMAWGGVLEPKISNIFDEHPINYTPQSRILYPITHLIDWNPEWSKVMFLKWEQYDTNVSSYNGIARHEFGHMLGIGDAYQPITDEWLQDLQIYGGDGVDPTLSQFTGYTFNPSDGMPNIVMNNNGAVTNIEIEMAIFAFATGKRQNFAKQAYYQEVSDVLK